MRLGALTILPRHTATEVVATAIFVYIAEERSPSLQQVGPLARLAVRMVVCDRRRRALGALAAHGSLAAQGGRGCIFVCNATLLHLASWAGYILAFLSLDWMFIDFGACF